MNTGDTATSGLRECTVFIASLYFPSSFVHAGWNPESDLGNVQQQLKSSELQENLLTDHSLKNSKTKDQIWKKCNSGCETREKSRVQTPEITREWQGSNGTPLLSAIKHQLVSSFKVRICILLWSASRIVSSVSFAAKGTQQAFFSILFFTFWMTSCKHAKIPHYPVLGLSFWLPFVQPTERLGCLICRGLIDPLFAALDSLEKCLHST